MQCVRPTAWAQFLKLETVFELLFILFRIMVDLLALFALQLDHVFLSHTGNFRMMNVDFRITFVLGDYTACDGTCQEWFCLAEPSSFR